MSDQVNPPRAKRMATRKGKPSWRSRGAESQQSHDQPNWRAAEVNLTADQEGKRPLPRQRLLTLAALAAGLGFLGWFVGHLLMVQVQTPFIAIAAGPYAAPFAPNSWAEEDLEQFFSLHKKTLSVADISVDWQGKESGLRELQRQLDRSIKQGRRAGVVLIYMSMHGVTDAEGNPCLIPPNASPYQSETWLPVNRLLDEIAGRDLADDMRIVLILDSGRMQVNWNIGLLYNGFTEGLEAVVRERVTEDGPLRNLVVLNSTSAGEVGWASQDLQATVFGHYLRNGLAGEADDEAQGGNGDRKVSLHELRNYLQIHVDRWARFHRGDRQHPRLFPDQTQDFTVAWALAAKDRKLSAGPQAKSPPPVPETRITELWNDYARYAERSTYSRSPMEWHEFQRQLLWLGAANRSGKQYERAARQLETLLHRKVEQLDRQFGEANPKWDLGNSGNPGILRTLTSAVHSLPLAQALGTIPKESAEEIATARARFQRAPHPNELDQLLEKLGSFPNLPPLVETQLPQAFRQFGPAQSWNQPANLQFALSLRDQAEQLAVPPQVCIHYWTRPLIDAADNQRRRGEDLLFLGDDQTSKQSAALLQAAQQQYRLAEETTAIVQQALEARDQTAAELPWLAHWLAAPPPIGTLVNTEQTEVIEALLTLIEDFHQLSRMMDQVEIKDMGNLAENPVKAALLKRRAQLVQSGLVKFQTRFDQSYAELLFSQQTDAKALRAIESLLAVPLFPRRLDELGRNPSQQREALVQKQREIASSLHEEFFSESAEGVSQQDQTPPAGTSAGIVTTELDRLVARWKRHPAMALLIADPPDPADLAQAAADLPRITIARMGARLRRHLLTIPEQTAAIPNAPVDTVTGYRKQLSESARLVRGAASLGFPELTQDPIVRLRRFDLQQLFAWTARRSLDDFWGGPVSDSTRFFEVASQDCLNNAGLIYEGNPLWDQQLKELVLLSDQRKQASQAGLLTRAANSILIHSDEDVATTVVVVPGAEASAKSLPPGYASVMLEKQGRPLPTARFSLELPLPEDAGSATFPFAIPGPMVSRDASAAGLRATTFFRGHQFTEPFQLVAMGGTQVSVAPASFDSANITLKSFLNRRSSIVFILDSSATMYDPISRENSERPIRKLDAARSALNRMLDDIQQLPRTHVGVFFYGHRVAARADVKGVLERQQSYRDKYPFEDSIQPYEDVEKVLELGRFSSVFAGQITERMELLKPWGETPLYLAITRAISEFENDDPDTEKNIVVVTDGINYQFNPSLEADTSVNDVLAAVRGKNIRIHIVGLGISETDAATAQREFGQIARATQGQYVAVDRATRLIDSLRSVLEPRQYTVTSETGETQQAKVRQTITVPTDPPRPSEYRVELGSLEALVPLEGGEAAELVVSNTEDKLESVRYEDNSPRFVPLISGKPATASDYQLGIHQPRFFPGGVRFEVSLQDVNRRVPPRPQEIWMEVVPKTADENSRAGTFPRGEKTYPRYVYYDANFTPDRPVPVLTWVAEDWPAEARFAEIRFWCNFRRTQPAEEVAWDDVINSSVSRRVDMPIPNVPGITWQLSQRGNRIAIVERHSVNSPGINALKVDLISQFQPLWIVRRFDAKSGLVSHSFEFAPADFAKIEQRDKPRIRFTTREKIHADSHRLEEAVLVEIGEATDVIQPHTLLRVP